MHTFLLRIRPALLFIVTGALVALPLFSIFAIQQAFALGSNGAGGDAVGPGDSGSVNQNTNTGAINQNTNTGAINQNTNTGGCAGGGSGLTNPLNSCTIMEFLGKIIDIILVFALPIIIFFIMYGGFMLVTANGEPAKLQKGRDAILWAVVGGVIALGAKIIASIIQQTVNAL